MMYNIVSRDILTRRMIMKILCTGGAGYIGSHTAIELIKKGYEVVIADNFYNAKPVVIDRIEEISGVRPTVYAIDVADKAALTKLFSEQEIDSVIHFAGYKAVGESVAKPIEYYRNNLDTTLTLLEVMREFGVKKIVFSSSATVYGMPEVVPLHEELPTKGCTNPYGWTKYMIEQILRDVNVAYPEMSCVLLRYFNPVGAHKSGKIGEDPQGIPNNLMPYISQVAVGKLKELSVFGDDYDTHDGTGVRDYIHVVDLAKGHVCAIEYAANNPGAEVINLGTGVGYSVLDMVKAFEKTTGKAVPYKIVGRRAGDVAECYSNPEKAKKLLGWEAEYNLEDMCEDAWRWQSQNPKGYDA